MADLKEGIFADNATQPHNPSPFQQPLQKRQFLRPTVQHGAAHQTAIPPLPQKETESLQKTQFPKPHTPFAPKFSLPAHSTSANSSLHPYLIWPATPATPTTVSRSNSNFAFTETNTVTPTTPTTVSHLDSNFAVPSTPSTPAVPPHTKPKRRRTLRKPRKKLTRGRLIRRIVVICSILTIIALVFSSQANGASGAWMADTLRTIFGPTITAQVESWYLGFSDTTHQLQYKLGGQQVTPPWTIGTSPVVLTTPPPKIVPLSPMPLHRISTFVSPPLPGEGVWVPQSVASAPYSYLPLDAKAFIRPDPSHPYAIVTLLQFDARFFRLHMVSGTIEPGGPLGHYGTGVIPTSDQKGNALLAAFNGGFKYADGQYGLKTNGIVYVPPQPNAATIAVTRSGQIILGAWGVDPRLNNNNPDLVAWRQNASLLINNGTINPLTQDGAAWGGTILNSAYTWRSAIGLTANGTLLYAAGSYLTALTLGQALKAAGAVMALQTDINPFWVRAFLYSRNAQNAYNIIKLNPAMYGTGTEYLSATERDFFYLTRFAPPPPPPVAHPHETASQ